MHCHIGTSVTQQLNIVILTVTDAYSVLMFVWLTGSSKYSHVPASHLQSCLTLPERSNRIEGLLLCSPFYLTLLFSISHSLSSFYFSLSLSLFIYLALSFSLALYLSRSLSLSLAALSFSLFLSREMFPLTTDIGSDYTTQTLTIRELEIQLTVGQWLGVMSREEKTDTLKKCGHTLVL